MTERERGAQLRITQTIGRSSIALIIACFILLGPVYKQVLHEKSYYLPSWRMFSGSCRKIISVRFEASTSDKKRHSIPWELVQPSIGILQPGQVIRAKRITQKRDIQSLTDKLCRKLGPDAEVFVYTRRAIRSGWRILDSGKKNRCAKKTSKLASNKRPLKNPLQSRSIQ